MKPMRPNVLTAFRCVNIWWNVREFCIYFKKCLQGHMVQSEETTVYYLLSFTPVGFYYLLFILLLPSEAFGSNEPTFVESYNCTGCRFIRRNASYNFTSACIAVVLTVSLIICFWELWELFNFACFVKLLCFLFQLLSASVNPRNIIFLALLW